ncbi:conserved hypothetical protein [Pseudomonas sp. PM2]
MCRSELAREEPIGAAGILEARVIVDVFREQARSYTKTRGKKGQKICGNKFDKLCRLFLRVAPEMAPLLLPPLVTAA